MPITTGRNRYQCVDIMSSLETALFQAWLMDGKLHPDGPVEILHELANKPLPDDPQSPHPKLLFTHCPSAKSFHGKPSMSIRSSGLNSPDTSSTHSLQSEDNCQVQKYWQYFPIPIKSLITRTDNNESHRAR